MDGLRLPVHFPPTTLTEMSALPIDPTLPALRGALRAGRDAVLQAPPGAGKTTRVPLVLLDEPWLGKGRIVVSDSDSLAAEDYIVAAAVDARGADGRIFLAAPLSRSAIDAMFATQLGREDAVEWDPATRSVSATARLRLGAIVLEEKPLREADPGQISAALLSGIRREGHDIAPWTDAARRLQQRLKFLHAIEPGTWPDVSDNALAVNLEDWLGPYLYGLRSLDDVAHVDLARVLRATIPRSVLQALDELAPTHLEIPSGSRKAIDYTDQNSPKVAVRLQEVFGLLETPYIGGGRVPLTFHLLSPAHRPVQITRDLGSFWRSGYFAVRKDLKGRYPKHYWPEDPLTATPVRGTRPPG